MSIFVSNVQKAFFVLILTFIASANMMADTVIRKDGRSIQGEIVTENANFIVMDSQTGRITLQRHEIAEIKRNENSLPAGESAISKAVYERQKQNYESSLAILKEAFKQSPHDALIRTTFQQTFNELYNRAKSNQISTPDSSRKDFLVLYNQLTDQQAQGLFSTPEKTTEIQRLITTELALTNYNLAKRMSSTVSMRPQIVQLLQEAVVLTKKENPEYLLALGNAAHEIQNWNLAYDSFNAIVNNPSVSPTLKQNAYDRIARLEQASGEKFLVASLTPTPSVASATPVPTISTNLQPVVLPDDNPATSVSKLDEFMKKIKMDIAWNYVKQYLPAWDWESILGYCLIIVCAIIFLWFIPYKILATMANRGNVDAAQYMWLSKKIGLLAFIPFLIKIIKKPRPKKRCQFCGKGIDNIEAYSELNFSVCPHCKEPISPIYDLTTYVNNLIEQLRVSHKHSLKGKKSKDILIEKDAMLRLVRSVIALSITKRASDFHLETESEEGKARARIDGIMYELVRFPREISTAFISAVKVMANLDITERRVPQDGKISFWFENEDYDLRINTSPAAFGEKVVIRILSQKAIAIKPHHLGMDGVNLEIYMRNIMKPHGVVIVTGPSGAGKSTTLYVALNELNTGERNIVTIEDPIEYKLQGLSQMQVNPAANFTFATGLRSILRQDPDVIMVGEIRDKETAEAALDAATTGHAVFTTLHTIDAPTAFSRMKDLGIETSRMAGAITLVIAQRLVRTICPDCRESYLPAPENLKILGLTEDKEIKFVHGTGCQTCMNTGYQGRIAIYEMLETTEEIRRLLEINAPSTEIRDKAKAGTMRTLREEGIKKIRDGLTTVEEVIRVTTA